MRTFSIAAVSLALLASSLQASTITFTGLSLASATLAGTSPNKLTFVVNVGGMTNGTNTATLTGAQMTFVTGLVDNPFASASAITGLVSYPFLTTGSSRLLAGGASTPVIPATTLMQGSGNGGASLTFLRTGLSGNAGTYLIALPTQIVSVNPTLASFMGISSSPIPPLLSFAAQFYFNANISAYALNATIVTPTSGIQNFRGDFTLTSIPEPATMSMLGIGLAGLALLGRRIKS